MTQFRSVEVDYEFQKSLKALVQNNQRGGTGWNIHGSTLGVNWGSCVLLKGVNVEMNTGNETDLFLLCRQHKQTIKDHKFHQSKWKKVNFKCQ